MAAGCLLRDVDPRLVRMAARRQKQNGADDYESVAADVDGADVDRRGDHADPALAPSPHRAQRVAPDLGCRYDGIQPGRPVHAEHEDRRELAHVGHRRRHLRLHVHRPEALPDRRPLRILRLPLHQRTHRLAPQLTRVCLIGPECTGKTTLAEELSRHFRAPWVPEFAREYAERVARELTADDVEPIAQGELALIDAALNLGVGSRGWGVGDESESPHTPPPTPPPPLLTLDTDLISPVVSARH